MEETEHQVQTTTRNEEPKSCKDHEQPKARETITYKRKTRRLKTQAQTQREECGNEADPEHMPGYEREPEMGPVADTDFEQNEDDEFEAEPEPQTPAKRKRKHQKSANAPPKNIRASKRSRRKTMHFQNDNLADSGRTTMELTVIRTKSWTGLLRHRMAAGGFVSLVQRLDYNQWSSIVEAGFGGILSVRTKLIPKKLARSLLEMYDPWQNALNLPNGKLLLQEEDVHATLGLPMGPVKIIEGHNSDADIEFLESWRRRWNVYKGGPAVGGMNEAILARGGYGHDFITDFISYAITTCIVGNANGTCHFRVIKCLRNIEEIKKYNWCSYVLKTLNDAVVEWQKDKSKFFTGSLLFLMLCYMDRVQFRAERVERYFPTAINWDTDMVKKRDKNEQLAGVYGKGSIIDRIDYHAMSTVGEADVDSYLQGLRMDLETNEHDTQVSGKSTSTVQRCPFCTHCNAQRTSSIDGDDDPVPENVSPKDSSQKRDGTTSKHNDASEPEKGNATDEHHVQQECGTPEDTYYCSPEFLEELDKLESMARDNLHRKRKTPCSPPTFNLGISLEEDASEAPTHSKFASEDQMQGQQKDIPAAEHQSEPEPTPSEPTVDRSEQPEQTAEIREESIEGAAKDAIQKGKQVVRRQQPKRLVRDVPYQCRSPYLKDYKEARNQLRAEQMMIVDYAFLPPNQMHPSSEKLFEYAVAANDDTKLWVFREGFETLGGADRDLDKSVVDALCLQLNWTERERNPYRKKRMFFTTNVSIAIQHEHNNPLSTFKTVMDIERRRYRWMKLSEAQLVFFPILEDHHFYVLCYAFDSKKIIILDNLLEDDTRTAKYKYSVMAMSNLFSQYLFGARLKKGVDLRQFTLVFWNLEWQDDKNFHDCGIYAVRHMEAFQGGNVKHWKTGFEKNKEQLIHHLRARYAAMILQSELNQVRAQVEEAARKQFSLEY